MLSNSDRSRIKLVKRKLDALLTEPDSREIHSKAIDEDLVSLAIKMLKLVEPYGK